MRESILRHALAINRGEARIVVVAEDRGERCGAVVAHVLPGRVASITPPQTSAGENRDEVAIRLLLGLNAELQSAGVQLAQALLCPEDAASAAALRAAGYQHAADLLYMAAEADSFPEQALALPFELAPLNGNDEIRLLRIVEATYAGTLDCPQIDGLRATADVLAGYRAVGESHDRLWSVVRADGNDVGCLLLADHADTRQYEVVYVGLAPEVRGRGWGLELTRQAQWLARLAGRERLVLAVDAANEPAIRSYATAGFRAWDRQAVWIKSVCGAANDLPATS
jgi:mycothiol synthase